MEIKIRSGGQSGVDRAALVTAKELGIEICGWVPKGGWAEDYPESPGVLQLFEELVETPDTQPEQRTIWNVLDADITLIVHLEGSSPGTNLTLETAKTFGKPCVELKDASDIVVVFEEITAFGEKFDDGFVLNVAGPRESEWPGAYTCTSLILCWLFLQLKER